MSLRPGLRALVLALALVAPVQAQTPMQDTETVLIARRAAQALSQAAVALNEAEGARDRVEALTATVRAYEEGLTALREGLRRAALRERALRTAFAARRDEIAGLTAALAALDRADAPLMLLHPAGPLGAARSGMLMEAVAPALRSEARRLSAEIEEARLLRALQEGSTATLTEGLRGAQEARLALGQAISERTELPRRYADDPQALAALLAGADTLESFAAGLTAVPLVGSNPVTQSFQALKGRLPLPVASQPLRAFGEADAAGVTRPGQVRATQPQALVTAPAAATIRYAGPLLDYGNVIVLEPDAGYLMVLAGLGQSYVTADQVVDAGAPLGLMGGALAAPADGGQEGSGGAPPETLYMELRVDGVPVDPKEWFAPEERMTE